MEGLNGGPLPWAATTSYGLTRDGSAPSSPVMHYDAQVLGGEASTGPTLINPTITASMTGSAPSKPSWASLVNRNNVPGFSLTYIKPKDFSTRHIITVPHKSCAGGKP